MRFLADAGISPKTVEFLKQLGHEAVHVRTLGLQALLEQTQDLRLIVRDKILARTRRFLPKPEDVPS